MKSKRFLSILLIMAMVISLTGCKKEIPVEETTVTEGSNTEASDNESESASTEIVPEEDAKLLFWTGDPDYGEAIAKKFEEKYGIPVTVEDVGLDAIDKLSLNGPAGTGPDVVTSPQDFFQHAVEQGLFLDLDESIVNDLKERVNEVGVETVTSDGKVYGVPVSIETMCLFYNKDIVGDKPATTLEEILDKAKDFNDPDNNKFYFLGRIGDSYKMYPFLSAFGFRIFGQDGTDEDNPGFDTDEFEKGLELIKKLSEIMPMSSTDLSNESFLRSSFSEGKLAYMFSGPWDVTEFKESGVNFGVSVLPTYNGKPLTSFAGVQNAHVSAFTKYPNAAQLLAQFLVSDEGVEILYKVSNKITTLKDVSKVPGLEDDENYKAFTQQFTNTIPMPSSSRISYFWTIGATTAAAVFDGKITPAEGRKKAVDDWNTMLSTEE